jgi:hypothetical protein
LEAGDDDEVAAGGKEVLMRAVAPAFGVLALVALSLAGSAGTTAGSVTPTSSRVVEFLGGGKKVWGVLNFRTRRAHLYANYDWTGNTDLGIEPGPTPSEGIEAAGVSYMRVRSCADGPCWWRKDHSGAPLTANLNEWAMEDPFSLSALIEGSASTIGTIEFVRGVRTMHYSGPISTERLVASGGEKDRGGVAEQYADLEQKSGGLASMSGDVWLDGDGLPRRMRIERSGHVKTWEYYDYGVDARIALPAPHEVMTSAELKAFMDQLFETSK